jgi:hypothetical protein
MSRRRLNGRIVVASLIMALSAACGKDATGPATPAATSAVSATVQSATVGTAVTEAPTVRVTDARGRGVPNVTIVFAVESGGGSVSGGMTTTDSDGRASVESWTLGTTAGVNTLSATAAGLTPVIFTATGTAAAPATMTAVGGVDQVAIGGTAVAEAPAVELRDQHGNPVPGVVVNFEVTAGGGQATGAAATTNAQGVASVGSWVLGQPGVVHELTANAATLGPVTFAATATVAWVATGSGANQIVTSMDGIEWTGRGSPFGGIWGLHVAWNGRLWVAVATAGIFTSPDGINWTQRTSPFASWVIGVAWDGTQWVATGEGATNNLATSPDGITWTLRTSNIPGGIWGVATNGSLWVAVGAGGAAASIATSPDGVTWTARTSPFTVRAFGVAWNGSQWVAVGEGGATVATSPDGITWTQRSAPFTTRAMGIAWGGGQWVATGSGGAVIATSPDGINWTARTSPFAASANGWHVAFNGQLWVAVAEFGGDFALGTSPDGGTWTGRAAPLGTGVGVAYARPLLPPF